MPTNDSSLLIVTSMQRFAHHGLRQAPDEARGGRNIVLVLLSRCFSVSWCICVPGEWCNQMIIVMMKMCTWCEYDFLISNMDIWLLRSTYPQGPAKTTTTPDRDPWPTQSPFPTVHLPYVRGISERIEWAVGNLGLGQPSGLEEHSAKPWCRQRSHNQRGRKEELCSRYPVLNVNACTLEKPEKRWRKIERAQRSIQRNDTKNGKQPQ